MPTDPRRERISGAPRESGPWKWIVETVVLTLLGVIAVTAAFLLLSWLEI